MGSRASPYPTTGMRVPSATTRRQAEGGGVGEEEDGTDGLTTLLAQYMSLSITARTAAALSASTISKLPFIVSDAGSDIAPPISVPHRQGASEFKFECGNGSYKYKAKLN